MNQICPLRELTAAVIKTTSPSKPVDVKCLGDACGLYQLCTAGDLISSIKGVTVNLADVVVALKDSQ